MNDSFGMGYAMGAESSENRNSGMFGGDGSWIWALLLFAILGGGYGGGFGFGGGGAGLQGIATRADINEGFALNNINNGIRGIQQGISDSTYALNNSITNGFHNIDNAICNLGYNMQQGFNTLCYQNQQCCCETQRLIERGFCDTGSALATNTANIVQASHSDTDRVIAKLDAMENARQAEKIAALQSENQTLKFQASQAAQNSFITASQDAQTAELIRRLRTPEAVPAYVVPNPNCCYGNPLGIGYNGNNGGCGCGC